MADTQSIMGANDWMKGMQPGNQWASNPLTVLTSAQDLANKAQYNRNMQQDLLNSQQGFMTRVNGMAGGVAYSMGTDPEMDYTKAMKRLDLFEQTTPFAKPLLEHIRGRITPEMTPQQVQQSFRDVAFSTLAPPTQQSMFQPTYQWDTTGGVPTIYAIPQEGGRSVMPNAPYKAGQWYPPYSQQTPDPQTGQPVTTYYPPNVVQNGPPPAQGGGGAGGGAGRGGGPGPQIIHPNGKPVGPNNPPRLAPQEPPPTATNQTQAPPASGGSGGPVPPAAGGPAAGGPGAGEQPPPAVAGATAAPIVTPPPAAPAVIPPVAAPAAPAAVPPPPAVSPNAPRPAVMPPPNAAPVVTAPSTFDPQPAVPQVPPPPPGQGPGDIIPGQAQGPGGQQVAQAPNPNPLMAPPPGAPGAAPGQEPGLVNRLMSAINPIGTAAAMPPPVGGMQPNVTTAPQAPMPNQWPGGRPPLEVTEDYRTSPEKYTADEQLVSKSQYLRFPMEQALRDLKGGETITAAGKLPLRIAEDWVRGVLKGVTGVDWPKETPGQFQNLQILLQTLQEKTGLSNTSMGQLHTVLSGSPSMDRNEWANSDVLKQNLAIMDSLIAMHKQWTNMTPEQRAAVTPPGDTNYSAYVRSFGSTVDIRPFAQKYMSNDQLDRLSKDVSHMTNEEATRYLRFKTMADNPNVVSPATGGIPGTRY